MCQHPKNVYVNPFEYVQISLNKLIKVEQFISEIWTLLDRVPIYIFGILKYHGLTGGNEAAWLKIVKTNRDMYSTNWSICAIHSLSHSLQAEEQVALSDSGGIFLGSVEDLKNNWIIIPSQAEYGIVIQ